MSLNLSLQSRGVLTAALVTAFRHAITELRDSRRLQMHGNARFWISQLRNITRTARELGGSGEVRFITALGRQGL